MDCNAPAIGARRSARSTWYRSGKNRRCCAPTLARDGGDGYYGFAEVDLVDGHGDGCYGPDYEAHAAALGVDLDRARAQPREGQRREADRYREPVAFADQPLHRHRWIRLPMSPCSRLKNHLP